MACLAVGLERPVLGKARVLGHVSDGLELTPALAQVLTGRAGVGVRPMIVNEVLAREGAVGALRLVDHGDMQLDGAFLDEPAEHLAGAVGRVGNQTLRPEIEAVTDPIDRAQQVISGHVILEIELVEERALRNLPLSHHRQILPDLAK